MPASKPLIVGRNIDDILNAGERSFLERHRLFWDDNNGKLNGTWSPEDRAEAARLYDKAFDHGYILEKINGQVRWSQMVNVKGEMRELTPVSFSLLKNRKGLEPK